MARVGGNGKGAATLNVGIVGLGGGASDMIPAFVQHPHIKLTAAADIDPGQLEKFHSELDREEEARAAMAEVLRLVPHASYEGAKRTNPYFDCLTCLDLA